MQLPQSKNQKNEKVASPPEPSDKMRHSLPSVTALWTAVAITMTMAGYAVFQKALEP